MSEPSNVGQDPTNSSKTEDATSEEIANAQSFTILIHGVGDETSEDLLEEARKGYLASGFGDTVVPKTLVECPTLAQHKGAKALLINDAAGGHFIIALPWNNRRRLAPIAKIFLNPLFKLTLLTTFALIFRNQLDWVISGAWWHRLVAYPVVIVLGSIYHTLTSNRVEGYETPSLLKVGFWLIILFLLQATLFVWAPLIWFFECMLIAALWMISSWIIMSCLPRVKTLWWKPALVMLFLSLTLWGAAAVRNLSHYSVENASNLEPYLSNRLDKEIADSKISTLLPKETSGKSGSEEHIRRRIADVDDLLPDIHGDLVTYLILAAIYMAGSWLVFKFDWALDFGLDVLNYERDERTRTSILAGLDDAILWLHRRTPNAHITVVGHSLGSVIASHAVSSISTVDAVPNQITLLTLGSPLNYLYQVFPGAAKSPRELSATICPKARWVNLWRKSDQVGRELDTEPEALVQYCIGNGAHMDYWDDGNVWKAIAYEALKIGGYGGEMSNPGRPARGWPEGYFGLKAFGAIAILFVLGLLFWHLPVWIK